MDVAIALDLLVPGAAYGGSLTANTRVAYEALRWEDARPQPSWSDLEGAWGEYTPPPPLPVYGELVAEVRGIRERAAAAQVTGEDARKVRDAVAGGPQ